MSRMLGRYELLEQLGEGGMGAVYLARLTGAAGFEKLCIVKTVLPSIAKDADFVSRFLHEGRVLTQLSHGNIAQVLDLNEADGTLFLALEYVAGVDLSRLHEQVRAANEFMPLDIAVALMAQAAEGLGAAHRKAALDGSPLNIVHRDVSPHNIMVSYEGEVKVIDFGIAKSEARSRHTAQASVLGKLGYMAPEQARGETVDHRADQYALAIVAWELLSNQSWVRRGTVTEMVVAMATAKVQPLAPLRPDVPPSLEAAVLKALQPNPDDRYQTTDAFAQALLAEGRNLGAPPTKPQLGQYVRSRCAQDFANQRQLLTRVTTQRNPGQETPQDDVLGQTAVRSGPPVATSPHLGHGAQALATGVPTVASRPMGPVSPEQPTTASPAVPAAQPQTQVLTGTPTTVEQALAGGARGPAITPLDRPATVDQALAGAARGPAITPLDRPATQPMTPVGSGAVPPASAVVPPSGTPAVSAPLTTGELALAKPSRLPLVIGVGLVVVVALAAAVVMTGKKDEPTPVPAPTTTPKPEPIALVDAGVPAPQPAPAPGEGGAEEVVDAGLEAAPPPPVDATAEFDPGTLKFKLEKKGSSWFVTNLAGKNWTACRMTFAGRESVDLGTVPRRGSLDFPARRLVRNREAPRVDEGLARLDCQQGFGVVALQGD